MTMPSRVLAIMQLFLGDQRVWTAEAIGRALDVSTSTAYRYVKELCAAGILDPVIGAGYALGPAIMQYDYRLRETDPIIQTARPIMQNLIDRTDQRIDVILCRRFRDCVLCIHQENGRDPHPPTSYARGVAMPLFLGATSKVILAHLPAKGLQRLYLENERKIRERLSDATWKSFKDQLAIIRRDGYCLTRSEIAEGRVGLAAPIFNLDQIVASISLVMEASTFGELNRRLPVIDIVRASSTAISDRLRDTGAEVARS
ncbi:MAG: HTH domain-containing protein [Rhizobiaceae bacterium]|nr:HTH domain-containing protein [Rhizobiaceae bacterium]